MSEGVVHRPEAVEVDQDERGSGGGVLRLLQGRPGALQEPLAVGEPGQRVAQLLLGAGAGDPQRRVEGDERHREQRQQHRHGHGDDADQRGDAEQRDGHEALPEQGGAGHRPQAAAGCERVPEQRPGAQQIGARGEDDLGGGGDAPLGGPPGIGDGGDGAEGGQDQARGSDADDVDGAVQHALAPAVAPGRADQDHHGEADQGGRQPAVEEEHGDGEGGSEPVPPHQRSRPSATRWPTMMPLRTASDQPAVVPPGNRAAPRCAAR